MKRLNCILFPALALFMAGFEGCTTDNPSPSPTDPRSSFVGSWLANETGKKNTFEATIELDPSSTTRVLIHNFANADAGGSGNPAVAEVSGTSISLLPDQVIGDGWTINGSGYLSTSTKINWSYTYNDGATLHTVTGTYTKQ
jgi:hypothetical protein